MFLFILGKYVGVEFLSHIIGVGLSLLRNTYQFSNMYVYFLILPTNQVNISEGQEDRSGMSVS